MRVRVCLCCVCLVELLGCGALYACACVSVHACVGGSLRARSVYTVSVYNEIRRWSRSLLFQADPYEHQWHYQTWESAFGGVSINKAGMLLYGSLEGVRGLFEAGSSPGDHRRGLAGE
jgi:hypothetical protein